MAHEILNRRGVRAVGEARLHRLPIITFEGLHQARCGNGFADIGIGTGYEHAASLLNRVNDTGHDDIRVNMP